MARLVVRVQPRASRNEITGWLPGHVLRVRVTAPPVGGEANAAVTKLLAKQLGVPSSSIEIVRGATAREKVIEVEGIGEAELNCLGEPLIARVGRRRRSSR